MGRLIDEGLLQEKLALIPMEERTFRRTVEELENAPTVEAIPISKGATNGDMIKALFPNCEVYEHKVKTNSKGDIVVGYDVFLYSHHPDNSRTGMGFGIKIYFDNMWWNAPYKGAEE